LWGALWQGSSVETVEMNLSAAHKVLVLHSMNIKDYRTDPSSGTAASSYQAHRVQDRESQKDDSSRRACFISKSSNFEQHAAHNLNKTLDPGEMPSLVFTIGGPKHCDLRFKSQCVRLTNQISSLDRAELIAIALLDLNGITHSRLCRRPVVE
jgi:hypothetical protein